EQERGQDQRECGQTAGAEQCKTVDRSAGAAESEAARLASVLRLRKHGEGLSGGRRVRLRHRAALPETASQGVIARHQPVPGGTGVRLSGRGPPAGADGRAFVSLRRSQSESRMPEIGTSGLTSGAGKRGGASASVLAPSLDSTCRARTLAGACPWGGDEKCRLTGTKLASGVVAHVFLRNATKFS